MTLKTYEFIQYDDHYLGEISSGKTGVPLLEPYRFDPNIACEIQISDLENIPAEYDLDIMTNI